MYFRHFATSLLALSPLAISFVDAKNVFAHYLVGTLDSSTDHAQKDIDDAKAAGFDAFALDLLDPTASYTTNSVQQLFQAAQNSGFKLFFSIDAGSHSNIEDFKTLLQDYLGNPAYFTDTPNGFPFLSTFDAGVAGGNTETTWQNFLDEFANQVYFVPDFDDVSSYYTDTSSFFSTWGGILSGVFSWETAWPETQNSPTNESVQSDINIMSVAKSNNKSYMMPLSTLQFKHIDSGQNWYRAGAVNMPERMTEILTLDETPDYVEVITWNDAGESHYIGNLWPEGDGNFAYANADHTPWQPLFTSFITAYKAGVPASQMVPPSSSSQGVGAMWYNPLLKSASCSSDPLGQPAGQQAAVDAINFAIVLPQDTPSDCMTVRVYSGGASDPIAQISVGPGLNYMSVPGMVVGAQSVELVDAQGNQVASATGPTDVQADSDLCNFNPYVAALVWN